MEKEKMAENAAWLENGAEDSDAAVEEEKRNRTGRDGAKAFAQRLNAAKEKWEEEFRAKLFGELGIRNPQTGEMVSDAVTLRSVLEAAMQEQERILAAEAGKNEEILALREMLCAVQDREEEEELKRDPVRGAFFERFGGEAKELVQYARKCGNAISLEAAFNAVLLENLGQLLGSAEEKSRADAVKAMEENRLATPAALGGEIAENGVDYASMSDAEFERVLHRALNGELRRG